MKYFLVYAFLLLVLIINKEVHCQYEAKIETVLEFDDSDDYEGNKLKNKEKMKNLVNAYIQEQKWEEEKQIDKESFIKMFKEVIQKSSLNQRSNNTLARFAEKTINKFGEPIIVKNLQKYFNIDDLQKIYLELFKPKVNTDL